MRNDVVMNPKVGDSMICPGCKEKVKFTRCDGWRSVHGHDCKPATSTHSDHIVTLHSEAW